MSYRYRFLFIAVVLLMTSVIRTSAADLPSLPPSSVIQTGVLDNGIAYYLVTNTLEKGKTDIALVQRGGFADETQFTAGSSAVNAMGSLAVLPHFRSNTPFGFLSRNCIWPDSHGYVAVYSDATVYKFTNLEFSRSKDIVDSTLLLVFDIIGSQSEYVGGRYSPQNQAIIISGDVDAQAVKNKMNMLSMLVTKGSPAAIHREYSWTPQPVIGSRFIQTSDNGLAQVTTEYISPRTPENNMSTVLPLVSKKFAMELEIQLKKRLKKALRQENIPVADISYSYYSSAQGPGDEKYRISITTSEEYIERATSVLSSVLAALDQYGVSANEYRDAQNELILRMRREYMGDLEFNSRYIDLCISSYLYGTSLASASSSLDFFQTKNLQDDLSVKLFNNFVFALLDKSRNLTLECRADSSAVSMGELLNTFSESWKPGKEVSYKVNNSDTLGLKKSSTRLKLKNISPEPMTGGQVWVFDNGIKVVYKNMPNTGMFHYTWLLKGGYSLVPGLKPGEGAYVSDMLRLYDVSGVSCYDFVDMLAANGISMSGEVTVSDLRISGAAPSARLKLFLKAMVAIAKNSSANKDAYSYYRACQALAVKAHRSIDSVLDSLMFPGNSWSPYKREINLSDDFQKRAGKFFDSEFAKMNDGVLILVGDFDEFELKKELSRELGGLSTEKVSSFRSRIQYKAGTGLASEVVIRNSEEAGIGLSAPLMYTASNYMVSNIAAMALQDKLSKKLASCGWEGRASWDFIMFPEERFNFKIDCSKAVRTGMPSTMVTVDSVEYILNGLRRTIASAQVTGSELSVYQSILKKSIESGIKGSDMLMSMLVLRYSYGKDLLTRFSDKINEVTADDVNAVLRQLASGRQGEFAIRKAFQGERVSDAHESLHYSIAIPEIQAWPDSLGLDRDAYRVLGLDTTAMVPVWQDSVQYKILISEFPKPYRLPAVKKTVLPAKETPVVDSLHKAAADSGKVAVDSLGIVAADSLMKNGTDSLRIKEIGEKMQADERNLSPKDTLFRIQIDSSSRKETLFDTLRLKH